MEYEYDNSMNEVYEKSLIKSFKKTVDDGLFDFIIVDMVNEKLLYIEEMSNYAKLKGFNVKIYLSLYFLNLKLIENSLKVYILELINDVISCTNRNVHKRVYNEINEV
jgi:hypothetical protein